MSKKKKKKMLRKFSLYFKKNSVTKQSNKPLNHIKMDDLSLEFEGLRAIYMEDFEEIEKDEEDKKSLTQCKVHLVPNPGQELGNFGICFCQF